MDKINITKDVMLRVKTIYWFRKFWRPCLASVCLVILFLSAKSAVFWQAVMDNMSHSGRGWFSYLAYSFWNTEFAIKILFIGLALALIVLMRDAVDVFHSVTKRQFKTL